MQSSSAKERYFQLNENEVKKKVTFQREIPRDVYLIKVFRAGVLVQG